MGKHRSEETELAVVDMILSGNTAKETAAAFGYKSVTSVYVICKKHGYNLSQKSKDKHREIISMRKAGYSYTEIADILGTDHGTIHYACKGIVVLERKEQRICRRCGAEFFCHPNSKQRFCTVRCSEAAYHEAHDIDRRQRKKKAVVDRDINLASVFERDNGVCYICGNPCDFNDYIIKNGKRCACGNYPSIDHVIPLAKGGLHAWENVRLAHIGCNSRKGIR